MKKAILICLYSIILIFLCSMQVNSAPLKKADIKYKIKPCIVYNVLTDEYFENNDHYNPNKSELVRKYICYDGKNNSVVYNTWIVGLDKVKDIKAFRKRTLSKNPDSLRLMPNTIVSDKVLVLWKKQKYDTSSSFFDKSPKGLKYEDIK